MISLLIYKIEIYLNLEMNKLYIIYKLYSYNTSFWYYNNLVSNPNFIEDMIDDNINNNVSCYNKFITIEKYMANNPGRDLYEMSKNPNLTWEIIDKYDNWDWKEISINSNITWEIVYNNVRPWYWNKLQWNTRFINSVKDVTVILKLFHKSLWEYFDLSSNPNLSWDIIQSHTEYKWDYKYISSKKYITLKIIKKNPKLWNYMTLSLNPNITWEYILENIDREWSWYNLSKNINMDIICSNLKYNWDWDLISESIANDYFIEKYPKAKWNYTKLFMNPYVSWRILSKNLIHLSSYNLSKNPAITMDIIKANPGIKWDFLELSNNPNLSLEYIAKNKENLNFYILSSNLFNKHPFLLLKKYAHKWIRIYRKIVYLKKYWRIEFKACIDSINLRYEDIIVRKLPAKSPYFNL